MGCGRIGQKVIELLQIFPVKIITYDIVFGFKEKEPWLVDLETKLRSN
jgi:phosphoglycerate dehydrogenase-like enzyme